MAKQNKKSSLAAASSEQKARQQQLFCYFDALTILEKDQNNILFYMLKESGALPSQVLSYRLVDDYRTKISSVAFSHYNGPRAVDMKPEDRFELCRRAVEDPDVVKVLQKTCAAGGQFVQSYMGYGLAQTVALFQNREEEFMSLCDNDPKRLYGGARRDHLLHTHFTMDWLHSRTPTLQACVLADLLYGFAYKGFVHPCLAPIFEEYEQGKIQAPWLTSDALAQIWYWRNALDRIEKVLPATTKVRSITDSNHAFAHAIMCLFNKDAMALNWVNRAISLYKKEQDIKGSVNVGSVTGLIINTTRFVYGEPKDLALMRENLASVGRYAFDAVDSRILGLPGFYGLESLDILRNGDKEAARKSFARIEDGIDENFFSVLVYALAALRIPKKADCLPLLQQWYQKTAAFPRLQRCFADFLAVWPGNSSAATYARNGAFPDLLTVPDLVEDMPDWLVRVTALEHLAKAEVGTAKKRRYLWLVRLKDKQVDAYEQTLGVRGWSKPKSVSLRRFAEKTTDLDDMTDVDRTIASGIEVINSWWHSEYELTLESCCEALTRCNQVYEWGADGDLAPLTFKEGKAEFVLKEDGKDNYTLSYGAMGTTDFGSGNVHFIRDGSTVYFFRLSPLEKKISQLMGQGMRFPKKELNRILNLTRATLNTDLRTDGIEAETVDADNTPVLQLEQTANGFEAIAGVRPFGRAGTTFFRTGEGASEPIITIEIGAEEMTPEEAEAAARAQEEARQAQAPKGRGRKKTKIADKPEEAAPETDAAPAPLPKITKTLRVERDFVAEHEALDNLVAATPGLAANYEDGHWTSGDLEEVLALLEELHDSPVPHKVEWPRGSRIKLRGKVDSTKIKARIGWTSNDWFGISGEVRLDNNQILELNAMLAAMKGSRFVSLGNGEYVALTADLRRKLSSLKLVSSEDKKGNFQVNALASAAVEQSLDDIELEVDAKWQNNLERMHKAFATNPPLPKGLHADLREYQREGYEWMQRLAIWGVGACLADDMGLGKTVQSIAVLLNQARKDACLVVAPTSVCANWELEIGRFAPTLNVRRLGQTDRAKTIASLGKNDVLIVGYGLLPNVEKELASREWAMVIFDEAQALKNAQTKRAKAGRKIEADFRLALTGTPIENRIDDLWSLFNIINPGLLGSWDNFLHRYGGAAQPGTPASRALRAVVRPFLLRRLKASVLDELPEKTEQNILIEPNPQELAFYESLRQSAVAKIHSSEGRNGSKRFEILAELTRLRRACCHPGLADPDMMVMEKYSSKTERFLEIVEDLISSGHKVLAFSQFTSYLALVQEALEERKISFQYLDGQTPEKDRRERVAAFQKGEGDVFLLSLKAGGTGLNLTAADYVIHLDPWWNPAVEDQASDRAHRIGQKRPVTIYRMVQVGSVEEKILDLHASKRELAADFLEGTETSVKKLTEEDLLRLLQ